MGSKKPSNLIRCWTPTKTLQRGMEQLALSYPYMEEKNYLDKVLQLFRDAGLELSAEEFRILLTLRRQTDQMLLEK